MEIIFDVFQVIAIIICGTWTLMWTYGFLRMVIHEDLSGFLGFILGLIVIMALAGLGAFLINLIGEMVALYLGFVIIIGLIFLFFRHLKSASNGNSDAFPEGDDGDDF
jgi:hypothetical protein